MAVDPKKLRTGDLVIITGGSDHYHFIVDGALCEVLDQAAYDGNEIEVYVRPVDNSPDKWVRPKEFQDENYVYPHDLALAPQVDVSSIDHVEAFLRE